MLSSGGEGSATVTSDTVYVVGCCSDDVDNKLLCKYTLNDDDLHKLRDAIEDLYYFEFVIGKSARFRLLW